VGRVVRRLPWLVGAICGLMLAAAAVIPPTAYSERALTALFGLFALSYVVVGALVADRRPAGPLGWLLLGIGIVSSAAVLLGAYAGYALLGPRDLPLGEVAAWFTTWLYWPMLCGIALMVLAFPEGRPSGSLRTWCARACIAAGLVVTVGAAMAPGPMDGFGPLTNPFAVPELQTALTPVTTTATLVLATSFLLAIFSIFLRRRRAVGTERGQLSWLAYATVLMVLAQLVNIPVFHLEESFVGLLAVVVAIIAFPAAVAVAILRHGLYDIDRLISRTLVYGVLTATLVATYLVSVLLLRVLSEPVTGGSDLAVAASTLAVAALFRPVRTQIQRAVDRHFFRSRYDPALAVEDFSSRLRHEVDLDSVATELRSVVDHTVRPTHVTLWVRAP
jgi:hypothetical protein